jgi:hypothetical protein
VRQDHEFPDAVDQWGWRFHHLGVPTDEVRPDEHHIAHLGFSVSGFSTSPFGVEWMRFDDDSEMHPLIRTMPHLAFVVGDLDHEILRRELTVLTPPNSPSGGLRVAMVEHDGAPIELMEFTEHPG